MLLKFRHVKLRSRVLSSSELSVPRCKLKWAFLSTCCLSSVCQSVCKIFNFSTYPEPVATNQWFFWEEWNKVCLNERQCMPLFKGGGIYWLRSENTLKISYLQVMCQFKPNSGHNASLLDGKSNYYLGLLFQREN